MRRIVKTLLILIPLAILVHDAGTGRMSVFRDQYTRQEMRDRLFEAVYDGQRREARLLLRKHGGLDPADDLGATLLSVAAVNSTTDVVRLLLDAGVDVNAQSKHGWGLTDWAQDKRHKNVRRSRQRGTRAPTARAGDMTPLHWAATLGRVEIAELLIRRGADMHATDWQGRTPLFLASINSRADVVDLLLWQGADPDIQNASKYTALMIAVLQGRRGIAKSLIAKGADLSITNHAGGTALHVAVEVSRKEMVRLLLEHGAEINAKDRSGRTPLDHAKDPEIQRVLREHGG